VARSNLSGLTSRRPFTILGIVLALLVIAAFVLVAINASAGQGTAQESVVVATQDLSPRVPIDVGSVDVKSIPVGSYPTSLLFHNAQDVKGMIPLVTIVAGEAITSNMIAKPGTTLGSQSEFLPIPSGYVAIDLPTSEQQGVGGYIQPDDYISVIATVDSNGKVAAMTVFKNLHVIRVGPPPTGQGAPSTSSASALTVVVTQCQAEYLTWFLTNAALKYSLESYHDYLQNGTPAPDPNCPSVDAAKGVNLKIVQASYPALF
jgi:Flp pilus assembly protein CpaB